MNRGDLIAATLEFLRQGGAIMYPLVGCAVVLWYVIGFRAFLLRRGSRADVRALVALGREGRAPRGFMGDAARAALAVPGVIANGRDLRRRLDQALGAYDDGLDRGAVLARTIVSASPLLGLLGTVTGMIGMFDSLGSGGVSAQAGGIARGISEALHTTELSLIVAIPGYFVSRLLERRAARLRSELAQLKDVLCGAPGATQARAA